MPRNRSPKAKFNYTLPPIAAGVIDAFYLCVKDKNGNPFIVESSFFHQSPIVPYLVYLKRRGNGHTISANKTKFRITDQMRDLFGFLPEQFPYQEYLILVRKPDGTFTLG